MINYNSWNSMSTLFSGMKNNSNFGVNIADYNSIRAGGYGKLMKAYYNKNVSADSTHKSYLEKVKGSISTSSLSNSEIKDIKSEVADLKKAVGTLNKTGSQSVFAKKDGEYDKDSITKAVKGFVDSYNDVIASTGRTESDSVARAASRMVNNTIANTKYLNKIGITMDSNYQLKLDESAFAKADMNEVKSLFEGAGSFGYQIDVNASKIDSAATIEAGKSNTYTNMGAYSYNYNSGMFINQGL